MYVKRLRVMAVPVMAAVIAACGGGGPDSVGDGEYTFYASSGTAPSGATAVVSGDDITFTVDGSDTVATLGDETAEFTLCPPDTTGTAQALGVSLTVGSVEIADAAVFGDCGTTSPSRITVVDIAAIDESLQFPFVNWVEFCDTSDEDCG